MPSNAFKPHWGNDPGSLFATPVLLIVSGFSFLFACLSRKGGKPAIITLKPLVSLTPEDLDMDEAMGPDEQAQLSDEEDIGSAHIPMVNLRQGCVDDPILRHNVSKPLPLGGPPGQVTIQSDFFFNKDLEYLRYGSKGHRPALSISKMKAAYYPGAGLEQMVPDQFWIKEECKYDIAAITVRTHMRILIVVRIEVFSMYGQLVIQQRVEDFQLGIESYQTQVNLTKPQWTATGFEYKHDYTVVESPRAVIFRDKYGVQMMMRFNEIHKFSDGTLQQIVEALDYRVKEFRINRINPDSVMDPVTHNSNPLNHSRSLNRLLFHLSQSFTRFYQLSHSELVDIEKGAVCSSLRSPKSKRTIESRGKRSSKIISLGYDSTLLASSYTVKSKAYFKSPTHYPCGIARTSE
uniref:Uncharacterized protein n=1 Tax=Tanacetum cinerariifolium TaxID=118510 RepID=A0A699IK07_TANCI|nr:hypothetical protein [Tanacetum cinerariifolium]